MSKSIKHIFTTLYFIFVVFSSLSMANDEAVSNIYLSHNTIENKDVVINFEGHKWEDVTYDISDDTALAFKKTAIQDPNLAFRNTNPEHRNLYIIGKLKAPYEVTLQLYDIKRGSIRYEKYRLATAYVKSFSERLDLDDYKWNENDDFFVKVNAAAITHLNDVYQQNVKPFVTIRQNWGHPSKKIAFQTGYVLEDKGKHWYYLLLNPNTREVYYSTYSWSLDDIGFRTNNQDKNKIDKIKHKVINSK